MVTEVRVGATRAPSPAENNTACNQQVLHQSYKASIYRRKPLTTFFLWTHNITAEKILLLYIFKETTPGFPLCTLKCYERTRVHPNLTPVFYIVGCLRLNCWLLWVHRVTAKTCGFSSSTWLISVMELSWKVEWTGWMRSSEGHNSNLQSITRKRRSVLVTVCWPLPCLVSRAS